MFEIALLIMNISVTFENFSTVSIYFWVVYVERWTIIKNTKLNKVKKKLNNKLFKDIVFKFNQKFFINLQLVKNCHTSK